MDQSQNCIAHYHLPGLFEFYELYRAFLPLYRAHIGNIFTIGAISDPFMARRRTASGAAAASDTGTRIHVRCWR